NKICNCDRFPSTEGQGGAFRALKLTWLVEFQCKTLERLKSHAENSPLQIAGRLCDNLLTCVVRAWDYYSKPFFVAPAMSTLMWKNRFTEGHIMSTGELGVSLTPPVTRRLACGDYGNGAIAEPSLIYYTVRLFF
ncbi:hypothetical protein PRUPE_7G044900, partial [Prunus persica]